MKANYLGIFSMAAAASLAILALYPLTLTAQEADRALMTRTKSNNSNERVAQLEPQPDADSVAARPRVHKPFVWVRASQTDADSCRSTRAGVEFGRTVDPRKGFQTTGPTYPTPPPSTERTRMAINEKGTPGTKSNTTPKKTAAREISPDGSGEGDEDTAEVCNAAQATARRVNSSAELRGQITQAAERNDLPRVRQLLLAGGFPPEHLRTAEVIVSPRDPQSGLPTGAREGGPRFTPVKPGDPAPNASYDVTIGITWTPGKKGDRSVWIKFDR